MALTKRTNLEDKSGRKPAKWRIRVTRNGHKYETTFFGNKKKLSKLRKILYTKLIKA